MSTVPLGWRIAGTVWIALAICAAAGGAHALDGLAQAAPLASATPLSVTIDKDGFHPSTLRIFPGQFVAWNNIDSKPHTATASDGSWDTGEIGPGHSESMQFFEPGKWEYVCGFDPTLRAVLIVATPSPGPSAAPNATP